MSVTRMDGQIGVLDAQSMTLRVFGLDGEPLYDLGAKGQGPGEFMSPRTVQGVEEGAFVVFDASGRVTRFDAERAALPRTLLRNPTQRRSREAQQDASGGALSSSGSSPCSATARRSWPDE
ncbi:MAG TPA: hypothetical protein VLH75_18065 [Longimicrobiales bacterium]|nr:hypothetical protein [Longimicrobiales bacterium]